VLERPGRVRIILDSDFAEFRHFVRLADEAETMKKGIHPDYKPAKVTCICGNVIETRSVLGDFEVQICSNCHPFFTGKQKFVDTAGRVERFQRRYASFSNRRKKKADAAAPEPQPEPKAEATAEAEAAPKPESGEEQQ
jgi:large subunit ribosomal protein L31